MSGSTTNPTLCERIGELFGGQAYAERLRIKRFAAELKQSKVNYEERAAKDPTFPYNYTPYPVERHEFHNLPYTKYANNPTIIEPEHPTYDYLLDLQQEALKKSEKDNCPKKLYETHDVWKVAPIPPMFKLSGRCPTRSLLPEPIPSRNDVVTEDPSNENEGQYYPVLQTGGVRREPRIILETANDLHIQRPDTCENHAQSFSKTKTPGSRRHITENHILFSDGHYGSPAENVQQGFQIGAGTSSTLSSLPAYVTPVGECSSSQTSGPSLPGSTKPGYISNLSDSVGEVPEYMTMGFMAGVQMPFEPATEKRVSFTPGYEMNSRNSSSDDGSSCCGASDKDSACSTSAKDTGFAKITPAHSRKSSLSLLSKSLSDSHHQTAGSRSSLHFHTHQTDQYDRMYEKHRGLPCPKAGPVLMQDEDNAEQGIASDSEDEDTDTAFDAIDWDKPLTPNTDGPVTNEDVAPAMSYSKGQAQAPALADQAAEEENEHIMLFVDEMGKAQRKVAERAKRDEGAKLARESFAKFQAAKKRQEAQAKILESEQNTRSNRRQQRERTRFGHLSYATPTPSSDTPVTAHRRQMGGKEHQHCRALPIGPRLDRESMLEDLACRATTPYIPKVKSPTSPSGFRDRYTEKELEEEHKREKRWNWTFVYPDYDPWAYEALKQDPATREPVLEM